jgi:hypothetical protein
LAVVGDIVEHKFSQRVGLALAGLPKSDDLLTMIPVIGSSASHLSKSWSQTVLKAARIFSIYSGSMAYFENGMVAPHGTFALQCAGRHVRL